MVEQYEFHIDPFGQQLGLWNLYTQLTFCYSVEDTASKQRIVDTIDKGLQRLAASFPWVAGKVIREVYDEKADYFVIKPFAEIPQLVVKDGCGALPDFDSLKESKFPLKYLDEDEIAPRKTKSVSDESDPKPVFLLQATFMTGGLYLTFAGQHGTMDIVGQAEIIRLLSKACYENPFTNEELTLGNQDRRNIVPPLSKSEISSASSNQSTSGGLTEVRTSSDNNTEAPKHATKVLSNSVNVWKSFSFSAASLRHLKDTATRTITSDVEFISTDDALSAFIWQCISRARLPRLSLHDMSTFARTVDVRRFLDIPPNYPGNLATKIFTKYSIQELLNEPLGIIASQLRLGIDPKTSNIAYQSRAAVTAHNEPSKGNQPSRPARDLSKDIAFSSWSKVDFCWELDFNLGLGRPKAILRPAFSPPNEQPMEGVVYLMPRRPDGEIVVTLCLEEEDMNQLCDDEEWMSHAEYIG